jgi:hypothetical protein
MGIEAIRRRFVPLVRTTSAKKRNRSTRRVPTKKLVTGDSSTGVFCHNAFDTN